MATPAPLETELKLPVLDLARLRQQLLDLGFREGLPACEERSVLWDRKGELRARGEALRVRSHGGATRLTWKGAVLPDARYKVRPEEETGVEDARALEAILRALGLAPCFEMIKHRAVLARPGLVACLDATPFGDYLELEGEIDCIQEAVAELGLGAVPPETRSYPTLFEAWRQAH